MRIAVKGALSPRDLTWMVGMLAERFDRIGVDELPGFNLYLHPRLAGEELLLLDECDQPIEKLDIRDVDAINLGRETKAYRFVHPSDRGLLRLFHWLSSELDLSPAVQRDILDGASGERWLQIASPRVPELTAGERQGLRLTASLLALVERLCGKHVAVEWLKGPHPLASLEGETPVEQLRRGGREALSRMVEALTAYGASVAQGSTSPMPPPRHFDAA